MYTLVLPPVHVLLLNVSHEQLRFNPTSSSFSTPAESARRSRKANTGFEPGASSVGEWTCESLIEATIFEWEIGFGFSCDGYESSCPSTGGKIRGIALVHDQRSRRPDPSTLFLTKRARVLALIPEPPVRVFFASSPVPVPSSCLGSSIQHGPFCHLSSIRKFSEASSSCMVHH